MRAVRRFSGENHRRLHLTEAAWIVAWAVLGGSMAAARAAGTEAETASSEPIPDAVWQEMQGKSWHDGLPGGLQCPARDTLVLLTVPYHDFAGEARRGRLIVAKSVADKVGKVFDEIFASNAFRIERIELVDKYGGSDDASMAANNTSAFNCRLKTSGKSL